MKQSLFFISVLFLTIHYSCVPLSKFKEMDKQRKECDAERGQLKGQNEKLSVENTEANRRIEMLQKSNQQLVKDSMERLSQMNNLKKDNEKLMQQSSELQKSQEELLKGNARETARLMGQLQTTQEDLQKKEDNLRILERDLNTRKSEIDKQSREIKEMRDALNRKDSVVQALKNKVTQALLGFENNGLTIKIKDGKVYVSMDEKLLFKSGSTIVDPKGVEVLKKLSKVLEQNVDINVMIEGHTDDLPYRGKGDMKDNWDLSVLRSTSVVKILIESSSIDPKRLMPSGRGEFIPVDTQKTDAARAKNRRTEIVLTPKLDELLKILENN